MYVHGAYHSIIYVYLELHYCSIIHRHVTLLRASIVFWFEQVLLKKHIARRSMPFFLGGGGWRRGALAIPLPMLGLSRFSLGPCGEWLPLVVRTFWTRGGHDEDIGVLNALHKVVESVGNGVRQIGATGQDILV